MKGVRVPLHYLVLIGGIFLALGNVTGWAIRHKIWWLAPVPLLFVGLIWAGMVRAFPAVE